MSALLQETTTVGSQGGASTYPTYLFAGLVGALAVFLLNLAKDLVRRWWLRVRERDGLLVILHAEILYNKAILGLLWQRPDLALIPKEIEPLRLEGWADTRVRLAQLLRRRAFANLAAYYIHLQRLKRLVATQERLPAPEAAVRELLTALIEWQDKAIHAADGSLKLLNRIKAWKRRRNFSRRSQG
jgi:hypothetical protein